MLKSTSPTSPSRLTRVIARKIHGGRKQSDNFWENGHNLSEIAIENKRMTRVKQVSPFILGLLVLIIGGVIWGGYNFIYNSKPYSPLSRVYDKQVVVRSPLKNIEEGVESTPRNRAKTISRSHEPSGTLYSWKDKDGVTHFSNVSAPQDAQSVKTERESNPYDNRTKVQITGNQVYVPVTITHLGKKLNTSLLLDTGCSTTVLPARITRYLNATHIGVSRSIVADGRVVKGERKLVENFIVGPFVHKSFEVKSRKVAGSKNKGLLGMDFLKHHPFTIDYRNQFVVWQ